MKKVVLMLSLLKIISAVLGIIYSILQVRFFGANALVDAFFVATTAIYLITSLTQSGQLAEVFLPEYLKVKNEKSKEAAFRFFSTIINRLIIYVSAALLLSFLLAPFIIKIMGPGLSNHYREIAVELFRLSLILTIFTIIASFVNTTLNAEQIFGRSELTGIINSGISIILLVTFYKSAGIFILVYSLLVGKVVEFITGLVFLRKVGFRYSFAWNVEGYKISRFFKVLITTSGYVGATQLYTIVLTAMSSYLPSGSLSIFKYVQQLSIKGSGIIQSPISTVFFSKISEIIAQKRKSLEGYLVKPIFWNLLIMIISLAGIILLGREFLQLLWSRKSLTMDEFNIAYLMIILNFAGLCFSSVGQIFRKTTIALGGAGYIYRHWIYAQLFSAAYAFTAIYLLGVRGLSSALFVNMLLIALVSFRAAQKHCINGRWVLKAIFNRNLVFFILFLISVTVAIQFLLNGSDIRIITFVLIKSILFLILLGILIFQFLGKEVLILIKDIIKRR